MEPLVCHRQLGGACEASGCLDPLDADGALPPTEGAPLPPGARRPPAGQSVGTDPLLVCSGERVQQDAVGRQFYSGRMVLVPGRCGFRRLPERLCSLPGTYAQADVSVRVLQRNSIACGSVGGDLL